MIQYTQFPMITSHTEVIITGSLVQNPQSNFLFHLGAAQSVSLTKFDLNEKLIVTLNSAKDLRAAYIVQIYKNLHICIAKIQHLDRFFFFGKKK